MLEMTTDGVPQELRPSARQLKNMRPCQQSKALQGISVDSIGQLQVFLEKPPECIRVYTEHVICDPARVCIPFSCNALDDLLADVHLTCWVCESLLLCPSAGPAEEVREDKAHAQSASEEA